MTTIYNNKYDIDGEAAGDQSGNSVPMNSAGTIVAIGSQGYVRVYQLIDSVWQRLGQDMLTSGTGNHVVSMNDDGTIIVIGKPAFDNDSGYVRVFYYRNNAWNQAPPGFFKVSNDGIFTVSGTSLLKVQ
jgi:hypothetical protein